MDESVQPSETVGDVIPMKRGPRSQMTANIAMTLFLVSWGITFAGLFMVYIIVRWGAPQWPPPGAPALTLTLPLFNTALALGSSVAYDLAVRGIRLGRVRVMNRWLVVAGICCVLFLVLQQVNWAQLWDAGLQLGLKSTEAEKQINRYAGTFYALTWFHAAHVVCAVLVLLGLLPGIVRGKYTQRSYTPVRLAGWFWHFVTVAWLGVLLCFYVF